MLCAFATPNSTTRKSTMSINKALLALAMGFALAACSNQDAATDSAADAADAAAEAQAQADAAYGEFEETAQAAADPRRRPLTAPPTLPPTPLPLLRTTWPMKLPTRLKTPPTWPKMPPTWPTRPRTRPKTLPTTKSDPLREPFGFRCMEKIGRPPGNRRSLFLPSQAELERKHCPCRPLHAAFTIVGEHCGPSLPTREVTSMKKTSLALLAAAAFSLAACQDNA